MGLLLFPFDSQLRKELEGALFGVSHVLKSKGKLEQYLNKFTDNLEY
jgi:hypothetical protein